MNEETNNASETDSEVAGATTAEHSSGAEGASGGEKQLYFGKYETMEAAENAIKEAERAVHDALPKAKRGEKYDKIVEFLAQQNGQSIYEIERQLETTLQNPYGNPQVATQPADNSAKLERKIDWLGLVAERPELKEHEELVLDYANSKGVPVSEAVSKFEKLIQAGKNSAKVSKTEKTEATMATSTASAEQMSSLDRKIAEQKLLVLRIKNGEMRGDLTAEGQRLIQMTDEKTRMSQG